MFVTIELVFTNDHRAGYLRAGFLGPGRTTLGAVSRMFIIENHTDGRSPME